MSPLPATPWASTGGTAATNTRPGFGDAPWEACNHVLRELSPADRQLLVARLAYQNAERRGFAPGGEVEDWLDAEAQVGAGLGCS